MSTEHRIASQQPRKEAIILPLLPNRGRVHVAQDDHGTLIDQSEHRQIPGMLPRRIEDEFDFFADAG
jgi:hypothetical protein